MKRLCLWLGIAGGIACGKGADGGSGGSTSTGTSSASGSASEQAKPRPPAPGLAEAAVPSMPRDRWPCAVTYRSVGGRKLTRKFEFGERTACVVPATMLSTTLGGCPMGLVDVVIEYDDKGRVTRDHVGVKYVWTERGPATRQYMNSRFDFVREGNDLVLRGEGRIDQRVTLDDAGRVVRHDILLRPDGESLAGTVLEWEGDRIVRTWYEERGIRKPEPNIVHYDCSNLPPDDPDPDADAGADGDADVASDAP